MFIRVKFGYTHRAIILKKYRISMPFQKNCRQLKMGIYEL